MIDKTDDWDARHAQRRTIVKTESGFMAVDKDEATVTKPSERALEIVRKVRERRANFDSSDEAAAALIQSYGDRRAAEATTANSFERRLFDAVKDRGEFSVASLYLAFPETKKQIWNALTSLKNVGKLEHVAYGRYRAILEIDNEQN